MNTPFAFYGTLMEEPELVRLGTYLGLAQIPGLLYDLGAFPALVEGEGIVYGRLWLPDNCESVSLIDRIEGFDPRNQSGSQYDRRRIRLVSPVIDAWVYVWLRPLGDALRIGSGCWGGRRAQSL
jgi:gamma-glutamylcyclotransferase (GGCT)/AIG2-like uncharacterized protein YtfP